MIKPVDIPITFRLLTTELMDCKTSLLMNVHFDRYISESIVIYFIDSFKAFALKSHQTTYFYLNGCSLEEWGHRELNNIQETR